jgi:hypothetical protein
MRKKHAKVMNTRKKSSENGFRMYASVTTGCGTGGCVSTRCGPMGSLVVGHPSPQAVYTPHTGQPNNPRYASFFFAATAFYRGRAARMGSGCTPPSPQAVDAPHTRQPTNPPPPTTRQPTTREEEQREWGQGVRLCHHRLWIHPIRVSPPHRDKGDDLIPVSTSFRHSVLPYDIVHCSLRHHGMREAASQGYLAHKKTPPPRTTIGP